MNSLNDIPTVVSEGEEPRESDSMIDDYLKGLNKGIGKLIDKDQIRIAKENKNKPKETTANVNDTLVLLIDGGADDDGKQIKDSKLIKETNKNTRIPIKDIDKHVSIQDNLVEIDEISGKPEINKSMRKEDIGKFIKNIEKVNEKMDKLDSKLVAKEGKAKQIKNERETIKSGAKVINKLDTNLNEGKEKTNTDLIGSEKREEVPTTVLSNLTVLEQTYTLEQYHKRYEHKCKKEIKALEEIQIKQEDLHGVLECNEELHADQYNSVPYEYQNYM
uniref:Uncharacterized protein n=1 Tax=Cacopsylla melanoneura TaxID=428564 RepID=A0A8D8WY93_9HEMI